MRGSLANVLFALAMLANLMIGVPGQAFAHQWGIDHSMSGHGQGDHAHQHDVEGPEKLCKGSHQQLPTADGSDCHCQTGLGSPLLSDSSVGPALAWKLGPDHGLSAADQIADSGALLPPLRPPRA